MINYMNRILDLDPSVQHGLIEELGEEKIIPYKIKYCNYKVIVYGAGSRCCYILSWLKKHNINIEFIVDGDKNKKGTVFYGHNVVWSEELKEHINSTNNYLAIIATSFRADYNDIQKFLYINGIGEVVEIEKSHIYGNSSVNWQHYFLQNRDKLTQIMSKLGDLKSQEVLCEYIRTFFMDDFYRLPQIETCEKYFGDNIFQNVVNESFVCLGGSTGDTIFHFLNKYENFQNIICFEGDKNSLNYLKKNLEILPHNIKDKIYEINKYVGKKTEDNIITLDDALADSDVSLISMDIEGMELDALKGSEKTIKKSSPILALSAYHKKEDIFEFIDFIENCSQDYVFYLRKYASLHIYTKNEIVLYAVPSKRIIKK